MFSKIHTNFLRFPKATTWLTLSVYLLVGFGVTNSFILCIGEDGHVTVETAINDCCGLHPVVSSQTANQSHTENAISSADHPSDEDHCGSCVDMPLVTGEFRYCPDTTKVPPIQKQVTIPADLAYAAPVVFGSAPSRSDPINKPPINPSLLSLSKIILLI